MRIQGSRTCECKSRKEDPISVLLPNRRHNRVAYEYLKKAQDWIGRAREIELKRRDICCLLVHQLWPMLAYGLGSVGTPWKQLECALKKVWWQTLLLGGVL